MARSQLIVACLSLPAVLRKDAAGKHERGFQQADLSKVQIIPLNLVPVVWPAVHRPVLLIRVLIVSRDFRSGHLVFCTLVPVSLASQPIPFNLVH